jgi:hypothetical protein
VVSYLLTTEVLRTGLTSNYEMPLQKTTLHFETGHKGLKLNDAHLARREFDGESANCHPLYIEKLCFYGY